MNRGINLIPRQRRDARRVKRRQKRWSAALTAYAGLLAVLWTGAHALWAPSGQALDYEHAQLQKQMNERSKAIEQLAPALLEVQSSLLANQRVAGEPDWSLLLEILGQQLGPDMVLSECLIKPADSRPADTGDGAVREQPYRLELRGFGRDQHAVASYLLRLEHTGLFDRVELLNTDRQSFRGEHAIAFEASAWLQPTLR